MQPDLRSFELLFSLLILLSYLLFVLLSAYFPLFTYYFSSNSLHIFSFPSQLTFSRVILIPCSHFSSSALHFYFSPLISFSPLLLFSFYAVYRTSYTLYRIPYSQRSWGVPIPVFYKKSTNEALMNSEILEHVEGAVQSYSGVM